MVKKITIFRVISMHQPNIKWAGEWMERKNSKFQENCTHCDNCGVELKRTDHVIIYIVIHIRKRQTKNEKKKHTGIIRSHNARTYKCTKHKPQPRIILKFNLNFVKKKTKNFKKISEQ